MSVRPLKIPSTSSITIPNFRERYLQRLGVDLASHSLSQQDADDTASKRNDIQQITTTVNGHEFLCRLVEAHLAMIPFENLAQHGGNGGPVSLELEDMVDKILNRHRGGFCLELNFLFGALLKDLGYHVTTVPAIVCADTGFRGAATHIFLVVSVPQRSDDDTSRQQETTTEKFMVDVGFGEPPLHPLKYEMDIEQITPEGMKSRILHSKNNKSSVELEWFKDGAWKPRLRWEADAPCSSTPFPKEALQHILTLVYDPTSNFSEKLVVVRLTRDLKQTLGGNIIKRTGPPRFSSDGDGSSPSVVSQQLDSMDQVRDLLAKDFGIPHTETATIDIAKLALQDPKAFGGF